MSEIIRLPSAEEQQDERLSKALDRASNIAAKAYVREEDYAAVLVAVFRAIVDGK